MVRIFATLSLCLVVGLSGCSSISSLSAVKKKWTSNSTTTASAPGNSSPVTGSGDFSGSNKLNNPTKIHLAYAAWNEQSGDLAEARDSYLKVLQKSPKEVDAILGLARIDRAYGRNDEAETHLKKAIKLHPKDPRVFVAIGQSYAAKREWDPAIENMKTACKLAPYDTIYQYHLAIVEASAGDLPMAFEHFKRSVGEPEAHFNIGFILNEQGRSAEAESHLVQALKLKPDLKQAQQTLASIRTGKESDIQQASSTDHGFAPNRERGRYSARIGQ